MTEDETFIAETSACLWESALNLIHRMPHDIPEVEVMRSALDRLGSAALRLAIVELVPRCISDWKSLNDDQQAEAGCYDYDFVPAWLSAHLLQGGI